MMKRIQLLTMLIAISFIGNAQDLLGTYTDQNGAKIEIFKTSDENTIKFNYGYYSQSRIREYEGLANFTKEGVAVCVIDDVCSVTLSFLENDKLEVKSSPKCTDDTFQYMNGSYSKSKTENQTSDWNGYYKNERNGLEVSISLNASGNIDFIFHSTSSCDKQFDKGTAKVIKEANTAFFEEENTGCNISFVFDGTGISIKGSNCDNGLFCLGFDGHYSKKN